MEPASTILSKCGGAPRVAEWVGTHVTRVRRWSYPKSRGGTGGLIPARVQALLLEKARENGVNLSPADFFADDTTRAA
jgi:hypothetical protein